MTNPTDQDVAALVARLKAHAVDLSQCAVIVQHVAPQNSMKDAARFLKDDLATALSTLAAERDGLKLALIAEKEIATALEAQLARAREARDVWKSKSGMHQRAATGFCTLQAQIVQLADKWERYSKNPDDGQGYAGYAEGHAACAAEIRTILDRAGFSEVTTEQRALALVARASDSEAQLDRAREALGPFASGAEIFYADEPDDCVVSMGRWKYQEDNRARFYADVQVTVVDIRRARDVARSITAPADGRGDQMLASASCPQEPDGWKLVPVEPTEEMDSAARAECNRMAGCIDPVMHIWDVMLAAAPPVGSLPNLADAKSKDLPSEARPVAWRWRPNQDADWIFTATDSFSFGEIEPLYTAILPPSEVREDGVKVKALVWREDGKDRWYATAPVGEYSIARLCDDKPFRLMFSWSAKLDNGAFATFSQAVDAAQADLEARIRSALTAPDHGDVASQGGDK